MLDGALVIDKPSGWTSHDVVNRMRRIAGTRKIGHLGTLDPLATGVLPLLLNRATRLAQFFGANEKQYRAVVRFGYATDSYDKDGEPVTPERFVNVDRAAVEQALEACRGTFFQTPPQVSAKKVDGVRAYKLARQKIAVELTPVEVTVHSLELLRVEGPEAEFDVRCSAGTYVRGIAHELGQALGVGAVLWSLRRTASGSFSVEQAHTMESLSEPGSLEAALIPSAVLLPEIPAEYLDEDAVFRVRQGRDFHVSPFRQDTGARYVKALDPNGQLIAIGEATLPHVYHPVLVMA